MKFKLGQADSCNIAGVTVDARTDGGISLFFNREDRKSCPIFGVEVSPSPKLCDD